MRSNCCWTSASPASGPGPGDRPVPQLELEALDERSHGGEEERSGGADHAVGPPPVRRDEDLLGGHVGHELHPVLAQDGATAPRGPLGEPDGDVGAGSSVADAVEGVVVERCCPRRQLLYVPSPGLDRVHLVEPHGARHGVPEARHVGHAHTRGPPGRRRSHDGPGDLVRREDRAHLGDEVNGLGLREPLGVQPVHEAGSGVAGEPDHGRTALPPCPDALELVRGRPPQHLLGGVLDGGTAKVQVLVVDGDPAGAHPVRLVSEGTRHVRLLGQAVDDHLLPRLDVDPHPDHEACVALQQVVVRLGHVLSSRCQPVAVTEGGADAPCGCSRRHQAHDVVLVGLRRHTPSRLVLVHLVQRGGCRASIEDLHGAGPDEPGVLNPACLGDLHEVPSESLDVVRGPDGLQARVESAGEPRVLCRDAGGAGVGVAPLGLDAADREHRLTGDIDHVAAEREGDDGVVGKAELAATDERDLFLETPLREHPVDPGEADLERKGDGVGEDERSRAGATLAAVYGDEVDAPVGPRHEVGELLPERQVPDGGLDAHRQSGLRGQHLDPVQQAVGVGELGMTRRADAVLADAHPAGRRDLGRHLGAGQQAAESRFRALAQLDLDGADGGTAHEVLEAVEVETALLVATAEVRRADLEDQLAAVAVVRRESPFAGVVQAPGESGSTVEGLDGRAGERAEAHGRDVHHRVRAERVPSVPRATEDLGGREHDLVSGCRSGGRHGTAEVAVVDDRVPGGELDVVVGPEAEVVVLLLGRGIHPPALVAGEGAFLVVARNHVLPQFGADRLEEVSGVADHREVAQQRVFSLERVTRRNSSQGGCRHCPCLRRSGEECHAATMPPSTRGERGSVPPSPEPPRVTMDVGVSRADTRQTP